MMRSLYSGVSGLKVHQTRMDVVGNNIANINTVGFKGSRTTFSDMLSQLQRNASSPTNNLGGINPRQIGLGAAVESIDLLFTDASPQQTGKNTDLALSGNGLFVLKNGDASYYTRNGAFEFDENGYYELPGSGLRVQGWNATTEGVLNTNSLPTDIVVPVGKGMEADATTQITYNGNLNKEELLITSISYSVAPGVNRYEVISGSDATGDDAPPALVTYETTDANGERTGTLVTDPVDGDTTGVAVHSVNVDGEYVMSATITLSDGSTQTLTSGYYEVGHSIPITTIATIYDSLGGKHEVTVLIDKTPTRGQIPETGDIAALATRTEPSDESEDPSPTDRYDNRWRAYLAPVAGQLGPSDILPDDDIENEFTDAKESDGTYISAKMNASGTGEDATTAISYLYFDENGKFVTLNDNGVGSSIQFTYGNGNGAGDGVATIDFTSLTQYANNTTSFPTTNGYTSGVLQSVAIDASGIITGTYTNGQIRNEAQIAVAQFANASGLTKVGTTIYQASNNSGDANVKTVNDFGLTVTSSALEMSGVDLATEFTEMIITQRGFQANSKMTTVADEMLETVVNMKR